MLKNIEGGVDFLHSSRSFDLVLITDFATRQDSFDYQQDEYHKTVVKPYMHAARENGVAIDYEYQMHGYKRASFYGGVAQLARAPR